MSNYSLRSGTNKENALMPSASAATAGRLTRSTNGVIQQRDVFNISSFGDGTTRANKTAQSRKKKTTPKDDDDLSDGSFTDEEDEVSHCSQ